MTATTRRRSDTELPGTSRLRRILVVRSDSVGDVLLTGPAVRALAAVAPVTFLAGPIGAPAARRLPGVDEVVEWPCPWIDATRPGFDAASFDDLLARLRARPIDLAVVFTSARQSPLPMALALRQAGVGRIVARSADSPGSLVDVCLRGDDDRHEVERNLALVEAAGVAAPDDVRLAVLPTPDWSVDPPIHLPTGRWAVVHPGSSVPARTLSADLWTAVVRGLRAAGWPVVLTGTADDEVTETVRRSLADDDTTGDDTVGDDTASAGMPDGAAPLVDLVGRTPFPVLAEVLRRAAVVCVGNTGPMHLAAAVATPVVATFAPTVPVVRWRPWAVPHVLLGHHDVPCAHCHLRTCALPVQRCLEIDPDDVVAAVAALVGPATRAVPSSPGRPAVVPARDPDVMEVCA